jgi:hypothetical protein
MQKLIVFLLASFLFLSAIFARGNETGHLEQNFKNPPADAKVRTWWHWMNGNVSREGITADLEAMKAVGIQEVQLFNVNLSNPLGEAIYLSETWLNFLQFSVLEAGRLGLEFTIHNGPGWSSSGGPWITPEYAMQTLVFSEVTLKGGQVFNDKLPQPETRLNYYKDIAVLAFPKPQSDERIDDIDIKSLSGRVRNHLYPDAKWIPEMAVVHKTDIIDLSSKVSPEGRLKWDAPEGEWIILRIGHTPTGKMNVLGSHGGQGLECDKMSKKAVDVFWQGGISPIIEKLDTLVGTVLTNILIDSYEVGTTNWTNGFDKEFERLRGYDCLDYLPALAGYYIDSGEISERFLWDFRRTIGDLMADNYYGHFRDKCHAHQLKFSVEPYWGPFDNMQVGATGDIVMCEFWSGELAFFDSPKFVASIAKLNGSSIVGAEAFTDMGGWSRHPSDFKVIGDKAWAQGINRFILHTYIHQPWNVPPGLTLGPYGVDFNRLNTWWLQSKTFFDYLARGQFLLQQGKTVADILIFTGESSPNDGLLMPEIKAMGYDYDLIGSNKVASLTSKNGFIYNSFGDEYKVLVLPETNWMTVETLKVLEKLAKSGATIIGPKPLQSPSLFNYPNSDAQLAQLADELWDKGIIRTEKVLDFINRSKLAPDFSVENGSIEKYSYIHRKAEDADIYFVANSLKVSAEERFRFRVNGKQPELWNAETGEIMKAPVWKDNGDATTSVRIQLEAEGSVFVVFRNPITDKNYIESVAMELEKPKADPLLKLKIIKAEYGTFLPDGLVDITEVVAKSVQNNSLNVRATRDLCSCDPAPGYKKELRIIYQLGDVVYEKNAMETEYLKLLTSGRDELKILKAVFGKFEGGTTGIPVSASVVDVTEKIQSKVSLGEVEILVKDNLFNVESDNNRQKALRVVYSTNGAEHTRTVYEGSVLKLAQAMPEPKLVSKSGETTFWATPYPGQMTFTTSAGKTKTIKVKSVPEPIVLTGAWDVNFPSTKGNAVHASFDELISWTNAANEDIRYFSGTASYKKQFNLPAGLVKSGYALQLDLGDVKVIAEVILNGKNLGILWKAPFRVNIDDAVKNGTNTLEVKITNLWPNRLIGDEQLPLDYVRRGNHVAEWPEWLLNKTERPTNRVTLPAFKHWNKDSELLPSGLLGPVKLIVYKKEGLN